MLLATGHTIATPDDADAWLDRMRQFPGALDETAAVADDDAARGGCPPDFILDRTIEQLRVQLGEPPEQSLMVATFATKLIKAGLSGDYLEAAKDLLVKKVRPALDRHLALAVRFRSTGRASCRERVCP